MQHFFHRGKCPSCSPLQCPDVRPQGRPFLCPYHCLSFYNIYVAVVLSLYMSHPLYFSLSILLPFCAILCRFFIVKLFIMLSYIPPFLLCRFTIHLPLLLSLFIYILLCLSVSLLLSVILSLSPSLLRSPFHIPIRHCLCRSIYVMSICSFFCEFISTHPSFSLCSSVCVSECLSVYHPFSLSFCLSLHSSFSVDLFDFLYDLLYNSSSTLLSLALSVLLSLFLSVHLSLSSPVLLCPPFSILLSVSLSTRPSNLPSYHSNSQFIYVMFCRLLNQLFVVRSITSVTKAGNCPGSRHCFARCIDAAAAARWRQFLSSTTRLSRQTRCHGIKSFRSHCETTYM